MVGQLNAQPQHHQPLPRPAQYDRNFLFQYWKNGEEEVKKGSNIIGLYPGQHFLTHQDKLIVVGAHWDTVGIQHFYVQGKTIFFYSPLGLNSGG